MTRLTETLISLALGVLAGVVVLAGLFGGPPAPLMATHGAAMDAAPVPAVFLAPEAEQAAPGSAPNAPFVTLDPPRTAGARPRWAVADWRCARPPAIDSFGLGPWRLASTQLELSTRLPETF